MNVKSLLVAVLLVGCGSSSSHDGGGGGSGGGSAGGTGGGAAGGSGGGTGGGAGGGCAATTYGSCTSADAGVCTDFTGSYWSSASARNTACPGGRLSTCGCVTTAATGSCRMATGSINASVEHLLATDVRPFYDKCQNLGTWQSTANSPDVTWWCKESPRAFNSFGAIVSTCSKSWQCGGDIAYRFECARDGGSGAPYPYACACKVDGGVVSTAALSGVCGSTTATAKDNDDLLADAGNVACGWQAPNSPTIP